MHHVTLRFWAGARAAAGVGSERRPAATLAAALTASEEARPGDAEFSRVLRICTVLRDGRTQHRADLDAPLQADAEIELLPPFAGG